MTFMNVWPRRGIDCLLNAGLSVPCVSRRMMALITFKWRPIRFQIRRSSSLSFRACRCHPICCRKATRGHFYRSQQMQRLSELDVLLPRPSLARVPCSRVVVVVMLPLVRPDMVLPRSFCRGFFFPFPIVSRVWASCDGDAPTL
jgi:hypothetical protein